MVPWRVWTNLLLQVLGTFFRGSTGVFDKCVARDVHLMMVQRDPAATSAWSGMSLPTWLMTCTVPKRGSADESNAACPAELSILLDLRQLLLQSAWHLRMSGLLARATHNCHRYMSNPAAVPAWHVYSTSTPPQKRIGVYIRTADG